jgi:hypothetical protein
MTESDYTLNELARRSELSKTTLLSMLEDGTLHGTRSEKGRRAWSITDSAIRAAGIKLRHTQTIDTAVRHCISDEIEPWARSLAEQLHDMNQRLAAIEDQLAHPPPQENPSTWLRLRVASRALLHRPLSWLWPPSSRSHRAWTLRR